MNPTTVIYLVDVINNIGLLILIPSFLYFVVGGIGCIIAMADAAGQGNPVFASEFIKAFIKYLWIPALAVSICAFIPSQKTMYMMMGTHYLEDTKIPHQVKEIIESKLEDYLKELKKDDK